jgi:outer membrane protein
MWIHETNTGTRLRRGVMLGALGAVLTAGSAVAQTPTTAPAAPAAQPTAAQPASQAQRITLDEAIRIALEQNPTVQQAENSARLNTLAVSQQRRALLPTVNFTTGTVAPYGTGNNASDASLTAGVNSNVQVTNIYSTLASIEQAKLNEAGGTESLERAEQTVVFNVMSGYLSFIEAQEQIDVQRQNLASAQAQEEQIQARVNAQDRPISDLYQQQAQTASARLQLVQAQRQLIVSRMNLIRTLQLDPFGDYEFVVPELGALSTSFASLDLRALSEQALAQRPDLRASQLSLQSAEQGVKIANATRWPTLNLSLGYASNFNSLQDPSFFNQLDRERGGSLQVGVSVPLLNFTNSITRERARVQVQNAQISLASARQNVAVEVRTAYLDLQLAEEQLLVAQAQLQAADLALQTAQQRYDVGADLVTARYNLVFQSRLMDYYLGNLGADSADG